MEHNKNANSLSAKNSAVQTSLVHDTDKGEEGMNLEQLNEYLVKRSDVICEYVRKKRTGYHASDILPPVCQSDAPLHKNIESVLTCFSHTLGAALFSESFSMKLLKDFEALRNIVEDEKYLIYDFLSRNGLNERFNEFVHNANARTEGGAR
ncbi:MAG: hypothetical protein LBK58_05040 [Prevotellaceae bacterium]|jgi:hypothetical protein|nr:hypothetical protein [Prevotellaceae bacterium]